MKLLFDENLPEILVRALVVEYPDSDHVRALGLAGAGDRTVWEFAARSGFTLVTKDEDFRRLSEALGPPPKLVWVKLGNCTSFAVVELLRRERERLERFELDPLAGRLVIP